jgi:type II secretory pathway pseudopilin PulG
MGNPRASGFTLVEMLVTFGISTVLVLSVLYLFQKQNQLSGDSAVLDKLVSIMNANMIEIQARPVSALPIAGKCRVRIYQSTGERISESEHDLSNSACDDFFSVAPNFSQFKVIQKIQDPQSGGTFGATFDPPSLRLSQFSNLSLRVVELTGASLGGELTNRVPIKHSVVIFKKDGP